MLKNKSNSFSLSWSCSFGCGNRTTLNKQWCHQPSHFSHLVAEAATKAWAAQRSALLFLLLCLYKLLLCLASWEHIQLCSVLSFYCHTCSYIIINRFNTTIASAVESRITLHRWKPGNLNCRTTSARWVGAQVELALKLWKFYLKLVEFNILNN